VTIIPVVQYVFILTGIHWYLGRCKSWNGDTEARETWRRLPGILRWLVSILEEKDIDLIFGINGWSDLTILLKF